MDASGFQTSVEESRKSLGKLGDRANNIGRSMQGAGKKMAMGLSAPLAGAAGGALKAAADFETAMTEVEKVTNPETAEKMGDAIRDMSKSMPIAQNELAGIAEQAGRLGVQGADNIRSYTETVAKMSTATDLASEEAADAFARIGTLMDVPVEQSENLGSAMNTLANTMGTSSSEITDVMTRAGGSFSALGVGAEEALALSGAMNEVSPSSRLAAGGMKRMSEAMMDPANVGAFAQALGVTEEEFRNMRENDPSGTLLDVADATNQSEDAANILKSELGKAGSEFVTLGSNTDSAREAMERSNEAWQENTSLQDEFESSSSTTNAQLQTLKNRLRNAGITIGNILLPVVNNLIDRLTPLISEFEGLSKRQQRLIVVVGGLAAALGPVLWVLGTLITSAVTVAGAISTVLGVFAPLIATVSSVLGPLAGAASSLGAVGASALAILGPIALVGAAIGVLAYAFKNHGDLIKRVIGEAMDYVTGAVSSAAAWLQANGPRLMKKAFKMIGTGIRMVLIDLYNAITGNGDSVIKSVLLDAAGWLRNKGPGILVSAFTFLVDLVFAAFEGLYEGLIGGSLIPEMFKDIARYVRTFDLEGVFEDAVDAALEAVKDLSSDFKSAGKGLIDAIVEGVEDKVKSAESAVKKIAKAVRDYLPFSPAKEGPLSDLDKSGEKLSETFASGMQSNEQTVEQASKRVARKAEPDPSVDGAGGGGARAGAGSEELVAELHVDGPSAIEELFAVLEEDIETKIKRREKAQKSRSERLGSRP